MACKTHRNWLICNSMKKCAYLNIVGIKYFYGIFLEPGRYNVFLCACCSIPSTAGTASTHVRLQENASLSKFSPVHICIEKLNATRGPYEACLLKPRSPPPPKLSASLLSYWSKRRGQQRDILFPIWALFGSSFSLLFSAAEKSCAPEKGALIWSSQHETEDS